MKKIVIPEDSENTVSIEDIDEMDAIFIKYGNKFTGMIIHEDNGWIGRNGLCKGTHLSRLSDYYDSKIECIRSLMSRDYECYFEGRYLC